MRTIEVCSDEKCGGCLDCQLTQAFGQLEKTSQELDAMRHIHGAVEDFVKNVDNALVEGGGEMPLKADASFRELRAALNRQRKCAECEEETDVQNSETIWGRIICNECKRNSYSLEDAAIGREWRKNSSLEKWFPLSAERLAALEKENAELRKR